MQAYYNHTRGLLLLLPVLPPILNFIDLNAQHVHAAYGRLHARTRGEKKISLQKLARYKFIEFLMRRIICAARGGLGTARRARALYSRALIQADNLRTLAYK
uniref:Uncharacterized protein n=1 Tax=Trichogramma kaykai TaxID=54128 RepID=A0ABD2X0I9_9HYME